MVKFNKDNTFSVSIEGCGDTYIDTIKALLSYIGYDDGDILTKDERYYISNLIASMLPNPEQIINSEDIELLRAAKQNKEAVNSIIS
ncbi:hypothetical protein [Dysgonomonas sp. 511]|uniref:hypothetical protein n=1 Tax=Dysgonomonas sp. 511 TaxID=2302930 RepID=UPI0013D6DB7F|nr:hypothetical protein [Dysgonomonas sp. 511]NDV79860.1 hypothetical protein [Dysgonomonas sp. 511]